MSTGGAGPSHDVGSPGSCGGSESLVARAQAGDRQALEELIREVQDDVYGLSLQMLWHPEDAEDAAQEILVRVITNLGGFRGESSFRTWVYRVASNHLLTTRKRRAEREEISFESFAEDLDRGLGDGPPERVPEAERRLLVEEVKIGCSQGMLLCLDRGHRLAYVLGEILGLDGPTGAEVLEITPAAFRKRLSRARRRLHGFLRRKCGLVDADNACRCGRRVEYAVEQGRVDPDDLHFAGHPARSPEDDLAQKGVEEVEALRDEAAVLRTNPEFGAPRDFAAALADLLESGRYRTITTGGTGS